MTGAPFGVVGSVSETTLSQLEHVSNGALIELDVETLLAENVDERAVHRAQDRLARNRRTVLTATTDKRAVERAIEGGARRGYSPKTVRKRVATGLAETAKTVASAEDVSGLFYTGGDIAVAGLRSLGVTTVTLSGG